MSAPDRTSPPEPGAIRPLRFPAVEHDRLENGLELRTARHGDLPLVTAELVLDAGAAADPAERAGIAQLTADALEGGTRARDADEVAWALEHLGIELYADASWDAATVRVTVPRERLEPALALLAEIVREPAFPDDEVGRLRDQQLATLLQRRTEPRALGNDMAARFLFAPGIPYARPLLGTAETVERIRRDDVEAFYRARFRPGSAALLFVGDIDADEARAHADRHFGDWAGASAPAPDFEVRPGVEDTTVFVVHRPGAVQSEIRLGHPGVERRHPDYYPLRVMNTILGGAFTSRLNMSLRERHGFTYGARSGFGFRRRPGPFLVQAAVATDVTARAVEEALRELRAFRDDGATEQEVASARDYLRGILPLELQTTGQVASRIAELFVFDLPDDALRQYRDRILAVSPADVHRVAREHIHLDRLAIVVVGDADAVVPALETLGAGPVEVHRSY